MWSKLSLPCLFLAQIYLVSSQACTQKQVDTCMQPLHDVAYDLDEAVVPTMNRTTLEDHCRRYDLFESCIKGLKSDCTTLMRKTYDGIEEAYDYLCHSHKEEYFKHAECFKNKDLHREGNYCNETLESKLDDLGYYDDNTNYKVDRICQYAEDYLDCVENAVVSFCGKDAAKWQRELDTRSLKPLLRALACPGWGDSSTPWLTILIAVLMVLALVIIATSVVMLFMIRRKKKHQRRMRQSTRGQVVDPPPAYSGPQVAYNASGGAVNMTDQAGPLPSKEVPSAPGSLPPPYSGPGTENPGFAAEDNPIYVPTGLVAPGSDLESEGAFPPPTPIRQGLYDNVMQLEDETNLKRS